MIEGSEAAAAAEDFPAKKLARQLDFASICRASPNVTLSEYPPQSQPVVKPESPGLRQLCSTEVKDGTPKKQKQCNCKNSKCLKLYCECFASGNYCDGCNCTNCQNNFGNEAARQEAVGAILERNPNAFRPKVANSPHGSQDGREEAGEVLMLVKHNKGCHCKKSGCLKRYCECFQANVLCTKDCRCMDCKNFEASEERRALFHHGDNGNSMAYIQQAANAAINGAIGSSGYGTPPPSKKRRGPGVFTSPPALANQQCFHRVSPFQQGNHLRGSAAASSPMSVPVSRIAGAAVLRSMNLGYRSPLADIIQPRDVHELCSSLVVSSEEAAKTFKGKQGEVDKQIERDNGKACIASNQNMKNIQTESDVHKSKVTGIQSDRVQTNDSGSVQGPMSPGTIALVCDEQDKSFMGPESPSGIGSSNQNATLKSFSKEGPTDVYAEQERRVLTMFRDFLTRVINCADIKESKCSPLPKQ